MSDDRRASGGKRQPSHVRNGQSAGGSRKGSGRNPKVSRHRSDYARGSFSAQKHGKSKSDSGISKAAAESSRQFNVSNRDGRTVYTQKHYQARGSQLTNPEAFRDAGAKSSSKRRGGIVTGYGDPRGPRRKRIVILIALVLAVGAFFGIRALLPFNIYLSGTEYKVSSGTTIDDVAHSGAVQLVPGNFVAVDGVTILEEGKGEEYTAILNGYTVEDTSQKLKRGDSLEIVKGADIMEESEVKGHVDAYPLSITGSGPMQVMVVQGHNGFYRSYKGLTSGITVQNQIIDKKSGFVKKFKCDTPEKVVAITFDDGPSDFTPEILDILKQYDAKATFFVFGKSVDSHQSVAKAIVDNGNQIALHGYDAVDLSTLKYKEVSDQILHGQQVIEEVTGVKATVLRAPYLSFTAEEWKAVSKDVTFLIGASYDSEDWRRPGAKKLAKNVLDNVEPGMIIQMRDGGGDRSQTVEALPEILKGLKEKGYRFVTIDELIEMSDVPTTDDL